MNSVGAGDSMVAGFVAGYLDSKDYGRRSIWAFVQVVLPF